MQWNDGPVDEATPAECREAIRLSEEAMLEAEEAYRLWKYSSGKSPEEMVRFHAVVVPTTKFPKIVRFVELLRKCRRGRLLRELPVGPIDRLIVNLKQSFEPDGTTEPFIRTGREGRLVAWSDARADLYELNEHLNEGDRSAASDAFQEQKGAQPAGASHDADRDKFSIAWLRTELDVSSNTLNGYAKVAGVRTPRRGQRDYKYSLDEVKRILEHVSTRGTTTSAVENAKRALENLSRNQY